MRRPPGRRAALAMLAALALSIGLVLVERVWGWPEALTTERVPIRRLGG